MVEKMEEQEIETRIASFDGWNVANGKLHRDYSFDDFAQALEFVNQVGALAEELNHHPEIWFTYGKATVDIVTHDAGGLTEKDFELAERI